MQGFLSLASAMVLQAVEHLSDEDRAGGAGGPPAPKSKPEPKPPTPMKRPGGRGRGLKRPAASVEPDMKLEEKGEDEPTSDDKSKPLMKKPAATTRLQVKKNFYKKDRRYGFTVRGSECVYVTRLHYVIIFYPIFAIDGVASLVSCHRNNLVLLAAPHPGH